MAFAPSIAKRAYQNMSVPQLESLYNNLKRGSCFETKEEQIQYTITHWLDGSASANRESTRIAIEELLKEKTGNDYAIEPQRFDFTCADIINCALIDESHALHRAALSSFFSLLNVEEAEKKNFLFGLVQDPDIFCRFRTAVIAGKDPAILYEEYKAIVAHYVGLHMRCG